MTPAETALQKFQKGDPQIVKIRFLSRLAVLYELNQKTSTWVSND